MRLPTLVVDAMGVFGGSEHDEDDELLLDVVKPVRDVGADEDDGARLDPAILVTDRDPRPARDHVVDLVLGVRLLRVDAAGREDVEPDRQVVRPHELVVEAVGLSKCLEQVGELECVHRGRG